MLKAYVYNDYLSFKMDRGRRDQHFAIIFHENRCIGFGRCGHVYISQCLTMVVAILLTLSRDQNQIILIYRICLSVCT